MVDFQDFLYDCNLSLNSPDNLILIPCFYCELKPSGDCSLGIEFEGKLLMLGNFSVKCGYKFS